MSRVLLFDAVSSDGAGASFSSATGYKTLVVSGTFDGATVKVQISTGDGAWVDVPDASFSGSKAINIRTFGDYLFRASMTSAGGSTSVTVTMDGA